jgi:hypothetical protein
VTSPTRSTDAKATCALASSIDGGKRPPSDFLAAGAAVSGGYPQAIDFPFAAVRCGGAAVVCGGSEKIHEINARRSCGGWWSGPPIPLCALRRRAGAHRERKSGPPSGGRPGNLPRRGSRAPLRLCA